MSSPSCMTTTPTLFRSRQSHFFCFETVSVLNAFQSEHFSNTHHHSTPLWTPEFIQTGTSHKHVRRKHGRLGKTTAGVSTDEAGTNFCFCLVVASRRPPCPGPFGCSSSRSDRVRSFYASFIHPKHLRVGILPTTTRALRQRTTRGTAVCCSDPCGSRQIGHASPGPDSVIKNYVVASLGQADGRV